MNANTTPASRQTSNMLNDALKSMASEQALNTLLNLLAKDARFSGAALEQFSNRIGQIGHDKSRREL